MSKQSPGLILYALLFISGIMLVWGVLGFWEYFFGDALLLPLQNDEFPPGTQFLHWLLITLFGGTFIYGFVTKFKYTPWLVTGTMIAMATLCFIETFDFMTGPNRYLLFILECIVYLAISFYLLRMPGSRQYFGH